MFYSYVNYAGYSDADRLDPRLSDCDRYSNENLPAMLIAHMAIPIALAIPIAKRNCFCHMRTCRSIISVVGGWCKIVRYNAQAGC